VTASSGEKHTIAVGGCLTSVGRCRSTSASCAAATRARAFASGNVFPGKLNPLRRRAIHLDDPKARGLIATWKQQRNMFGIRLAFTPTTGKWLTDGTADWFWPAAEKAGIPMMFLGGGMPNFARIAERHPQLQLIIDHMGLSIAIAQADRREETIAASVSLAKYPNVSIKLSSAPAYSAEAYPYRDMLPRSGAASIPSGRSGASGAPTSPTRFPRRPTGSASPISPRNSPSLRTGQGLGDGPRDPRVLW
jgi:hypothetical protein